MCGGLNAHMCPLGPLNRRANYVWRPHAAHAACRPNNLRIPLKPSSVVPWIPHRPGVIFTRPRPLPVRWGPLPELGLGRFRLLGIESWFFVTTFGHGTVKKNRLFTIRNLFSFKSLLILIFRFLGIDKALARTSILGLGALCLAYKCSLAAGSIGNLEIRACVADGLKRVNHFHD